MNRLSEEQKTEIVRYLVQRFDAYCVILFGSAAKDALRPDSDIDIAYLSDTDRSHYERFMAAQEMAGPLRREVDLIDFGQASPVLQTQIIDKGVTLADDRPLDRQYAFMRALKKYVILNEERKEILRNYGFDAEG